MNKNRLEAFSDGVIAIIITIMVLELKVPHGGDLAMLKPLLPVFFSYVLSFVYIGIYWNNHHHLFHAAQKVNGQILWANLHLLFWLSLVPAITAWMGENSGETWPLVLYGIVLCFAGIAYFILSQLLLAHHGPQSTLAKAIGPDTKGKISVVVYLIGIALAFVQPWLAYIAYVSVAIIWFIPDRRIEDRLN